MVEVSTIVYAFAQYFMQSSSIRNYSNPAPSHWQLSSFCSARNYEFFRQKKFVDGIVIIIVYNVALSKLKNHTLFLFFFGNWPK